MGFYWKDKKDQVSVAPSFVFGRNDLISNQLFARRGHLSNKTNDPWTAFEMELREPAPIPSVFDFTQFLVSSITFKTHLREVSVYLDDKRLVRLTKDTGIPKQIPIPPGLRPTSTMGFMNIKGWKATRTWFLDNEVRSLSNTVALYSHPHYRGSHGLHL